ncbi:MAG: phosphoglucosamine mutase [Crocinitomicaceae bacterium]|jgi:phosphomannomutase|nr:phosphoglucosamine mutase [Crocinitomicaceae bacterium]MDP4865575.1 phosphoglucosamine mutase [Crocinitomicaceae bacterium]MDP5011002.1 phosphoglucosamine mutase [Crocinitomicaceae bacterium]MDP5098990.1 phosphoglucosamine mutase [Crocinitomicaceae bacterium]
MTLIKSISGIRGTIGGKVDQGLTPIDAVKFAAAYGTWLKNRNEGQALKVVIGRDARISGQMISDLVVSTLVGLGIDVINLGLSTTPTVEVAVPLEKAQGGIILTASHNPKQWNALKLLNEKGEFISGSDGEEVLAIAEKEAFDFAEVDDLGKVTIDDSYLQKHIDAILALPLVDKKAIEAANFSIVVDAVNSTGGIFVPALLKALGVNQITELYCDPTGHFPHNPEPLPEHLTDLSNKIKEVGADVGITVDPDVDRLALVCEDGSMFGEEYTLVAVADYVLTHTPGATVSNLSSTRALRDVTESRGLLYSAAAVGEVNVVTKMKETNAVIGGEGNGGVIYPELHYGRDSLVGIALFLSHLAHKKMTVSQLRDSYPKYTISKNKIELTPDIDVDQLLMHMTINYAHEEVDTTDGVKIYIGKEWVHLRKSNTEPIIRIYSESENEQKANDLAERIIFEIKALV